MLLDDLIARVEGSPALAKEVNEAARNLKWVPNPGPQTDAYFSAADVLLYGGQGGGGKSDLGLGLAFSSHRRSMILRREYTNLGALVDRAIEIHGGRTGFNGSPPPSLRFTRGKDDCLITFAACQHLGDEQAFQGQPYDLKVFDEATHFLELQVRFHIGWLRSTIPGQRCRAVLPTNPPINSDGDWIIGMFRPWLDLTHPKPAKHGELRWFVTAPDGSDLEVESGEPVEIDGRKLIPMSRTFIPSALADNPFLVNTGYQAKLDGLPEPLRSAVRDGNFMAARSDAPNQVIPTQWIIDAQARWKPDGWRGLAMTAMAIDPAGGGGDAQEVAYRYGGWFGPLVSEKGEETADGGFAASTIFKHRKDGCPIIVDVGGGYGGAVVLRLNDNGVAAIKFNNAGASSGIARDGSSRRFANKRAEAWWRFREALDPEQEGGSLIALPPDPELRSDLAAPTFRSDMVKIQIESKDDIRKRLGRSPGKGDAVVMAFSEGQLAEKRQQKLNAASRGMQTRANIGHANAKRFYGR